MGNNENENKSKGEEMLSALMKKREEYSKNSEKFAAVRSFLFRYSRDSSLPDDLKYLFRKCSGQPFQDVIYSTLIYDIPAEEWDSLSYPKRRELLIEKSAELYYLQRKLNKCIGRTFYDSLVKDSALLWHIKDEIVYRFPFMEKDFDCMEKEGFDYPEETFEKYINIYKESYKPNSDFTSRDTTNFVKKVRNCFLMHKEKGGHFIKDEKTFWLAVTTTRTKSNVTLFTKEMNDSYGRRLFPTKDDLFVFAIAMRLPYEEFKNLVKDAEKDCGDSARYTYDNTDNLRDALILSVIRDIDGWYEMTAAELHAAELQEAEPHAASKVSIDKKVIMEKSNYPMEVLFRVDEMLWENLCRSEPEASLEKLLYHSFLLDRGDQLYARKYREWIKEQKARKKEMEEKCKEFVPETIIDFQTKVRQDLKKARRKAIYKEV